MIVFFDFLDELGDDGRTLAVVDALGDRDDAAAENVVAVLDLVAEALDVISSGRPKMFEFGVADETAWEVGLSCGGKIRVYIERVG